MYGQNEEIPQVSVPHHGPSAVGWMLEFPKNSSS